MGLLGDRRRSVAAIFGRRRQDDPGRGRVLPWELGLDRFPPRGVLVQFSSPGSAQCRICLNRLAAAAAAHRGDALVVELLVEHQSRVAERMGVRIAPTVLQLDSRGDVLRRWTRPPDRRELERALSGSAELAFGAG
jgi:hypothetical protein